MSIFVTRLKKVKRVRGWKYPWLAFLFSENRQELHDLAYRLKLHPYMFCNSAHFPHYRLTQRKYYKALDLGALPITDEALQTKIKQSTACAETDDGN